MKGLKTCLSTIPSSLGNVTFQTAIFLIHYEVNLTVISHLNMHAESKIITFSAWTLHRPLKPCIKPIFSHSCDICGNVYTTEVSLQNHMLQLGIQNLHDNSYGMSRTV